jgi:Zn-dependent protease
VFTFIDLTLWQILTRLAAFIILISVHGFVVAALIRWTGDMTPVYAGRRTFEPFRNMSLLGLVGAVLFKLGWILPMPFDAAKASAQRGKMVVVVIGSLAAVLLLVPVISLIRPQVVTIFPLLTAQMLLAVLDTTQDFAIWFVAFNMLPLPPLTGYLLLAAFAPSAARIINQKPKAAEFVMLIIVWIGVGRMVVSPINAWLRTFITY